MTSRESIFRYAMLQALFLCAFLWAGGRTSLCQANYTQATANEVIKSSRELVASNRLSEATILLSQLVEREPSNTEALTLLGQLEGRLGEHPKAITILRRVVSLSPLSSTELVNVAIALADSGDFSRALQEVERSLALEPKLAIAHLNRARVLADLHRAAEARAEFVRTSQLDPDNADVYFYWAFLERESGNLLKETSLLEKVTALQPSNDKAFLLLGRSLSEQSRDTEAISALQSAIAINPQSSTALYMLSRKLRRSDPKAATQLTEKFQQTRDRNERFEASKALGNQAFEANIREDWPESVRLLRIAIDTCGDCEAAAALHKNLGLSLCRAGDTSSGTEELRTSFQLNPNDPDVIKALKLLTNSPN